MLNNGRFLQVSSVIHLFFISLHHKRKRNNMKKLILFLLGIIAISFTSCEERELARIDCCNAVYNYEYKRDSIKLAYVIKAHNNTDWRPNIDELTNSIKAESEKIVAESFDGLYNTYSESYIEKLFFIYMGVVLPNKQELHKYYNAKATSSIMNDICLTISTNKILTPTEEDIKEILNN